MLFLPVLRPNGQSLTEYALILGLIAAVTIAVLLLFGQTLVDVFTNILNTLQGVPG